MSKLLDHFNAMQGMVTRYLQPGPYTDREGIVSTDADTDVGGDFEVKFAKELFVGDMIYMLDGPEQRDAEAAAAREAKELADAADWRMDIRKQVAQADTVAKELSARLKAEVEASNDLRTRLMNSELAYAQLRGYLEGKLDSEPAPMVQMPREPFHARMPDGSQGAASGRHHGWSVSDSPPKSWYHK